MARNKWMAQLQKLEGAVVERTNPFNNVIKTPSPSVNFIFAKGHGLPLGYTAVVFGPPKAGKSILSHMLVGNLHQNDPEAIAVKFDTEFRSGGQLNEDDAERLFGIDLDRLQPIEENRPEYIFDTIETQLNAMVQDGAPLKLVIIDSLYGVIGRRASDTNTVSKQIIGDHAATIQDGLKRILRIQRRCKFALVLIDQVRAEMDLTEQMRGNKTKMRSAFAVQHHAEYFIEVTQNKNKDGKIDLSGNEFVNEELTDLAGKGEKTGLKIRVKMRENSMGVAGRTGEFTFDFHRGIINVHEEVFRLGVNRGIIHRPNNLMYEFNGQSWRGVAATLEALKNNPELQSKIVTELQQRDMAGELPKATESDEDSDLEEGDDE